jgi:hypothetical protein
MLSILTFWIVTPCSLVAVTTVSERRIASIFKAEEYRHYRENLKSPNFYDEAKHADFRG